MPRRHTLTERQRRTLLALPTDEPSLLKQDTGLDPLSDFSQTCDEWSAQRRCRVEQHLVRWCHGVSRDRPASSDPIPLRNEDRWLLSGTRGSESVTRGMMVW